MLLHILHFIVFVMFIILHSNNSINLLTFCFMLFHCHSNAKASMYRKMSPVIGHTHIMFLHIIFSYIASFCIHSNGKNRKKTLRYACFFGANLILCPVPHTPPLISLQSYSKFRWKWMF